MFEYEILGWDEAEHFVDKDGGKIALQPLYLDGLRLRMAVLACRVWPDPKARARAQMIADRDEYMPQWHGGHPLSVAIETSGSPIDIRFFRTPCRLMRIMNHLRGEWWGADRRFDSMMQFVLRSHLLPNGLEAFGVFPFRPRNYNGQPCVPIPRFLAEMRPVARIEFGKGRRLGRFGATVSFGQME